jgi:hypothetical protein
MKYTIIQFGRVFDFDFDFLIERIHSKMHKSPLHNALESLICMTMRCTILLAHIDINYSNIIKKYKVLLKY